MLRYRYAFFVLFITIFKSSFAQNNLLVPEVCVARVAEMGVFGSADPSDAKNLSIVREKLRSNNFDQQQIDLNALSNSFAATLKEINRQLKDNQTPLFKYLVNCKNDHAACHGYFNIFLSNQSPQKIQETLSYSSQLLYFQSKQPKLNVTPFITVQPSILSNEEKFRRNIYCDRVIYRALVGKTMETRENQYNQCINQPMMVEQQYFKTIAKNRDIATCYYKTEVDGQTFLKNNYEAILKKYELASNCYDKSAEIAITEVQKSFLPEGFIFVMMKASEDFQDISKIDSKSRELNDYYNKLSVAKTFYDFENEKLNLQEQQRSAAKIQKFGGNLLDKLVTPEVLVFEPEDFFTKVVFQEAERQYWIDRLKNNSPLLLNAQEKFAYFSYLDKNPYFFNDQTTTFSDFVQNPSIYQSNLSTTQNQENPGAQNQYKQKMQYRDFQTYDSDVHNEIQPGTKPLIKDPKLRKSVEADQLKNKESKITKQFIFDPIFRNSYLHQLKRDATNQNDKELEDAQQKGEYYPKMFKAVLQYQFARVTQARVLREFQKLNINEVGTSPFAPKPKNPLPLDTFVQFHKWVEHLTCQGHEKTFCSSAHKNFRIVKHKELYEKIISGQFALNYISDPSITHRDYIYGKSFIDQANQKMKAINDFCYENADSTNFKKNPNNYQGMIDAQMENFYRIPRMDQISDQQGFSDAFQYHPDQYSSDCFTKGYVFGGQYFSDVSLKRISDVLRTAGPGANPNLDQLVSDLPLRVAYVPSKFKMENDALHDVEDHEEKMISKEFDTLQENYSYDNMQSYESFLKDSAATRIMALVDYAVDNPSEKIAQYICHLINISDASEYVKQQRIELAWNVAFIAASLTTFYIPGALEIEGLFAVSRTSAIVLHRAGTAIVIAAISAGSAEYKISYYRDKKEALDIAGLTKNLDYTDTQLIHLVYDHKNSDAKVTALIDFGLLVVFGGRAIYDSGAELQKLFSKEFNAIRKSRLLELTEITRNTSGETQFHFSSDVENYLLDSKKVSNEHFRDFKEQLKIGSYAAENFLIQTWGSQIGTLVEKDIFSRRMNELRDIMKDPQSNAKMDYNQKVMSFLGSSKVSEELFAGFKDAFKNGKDASDQFLQAHWGNELGPDLVRAKTRWQQFVDQVSENPHIQDAKTWAWDRSLFVKAYYYKVAYQLKQLVRSILIKDAKMYFETFPYKQLENENRAIRMIHESQMLQERTGREIFNQEDIDKLASNMKFFQLDEATGVFRRITDVDMDEAYDLFIQKVVVANQTEVEAYLEPLIGSELLKDEWLTVLRTFNRQIGSVEDCKSFLKAIKYAEKQYSGLFAQARNAGELLDSRELLGTYVYQKRTATILNKINEFYDLAQYTRAKNDIRFVEYLNQHFDEAKINIKEIEQNIQFDPDFQYRQKLENYDFNRRAVAKFETDHPEYFMPRSGSDPLKYEKDFIKQEKDFNDFFHQKLKKYFNEINDPVKAYEKALDKIQERKMIEFECSLPESFHKSNINRLYRKSAGLIALGTSVMGYYGSHAQDEKNAEWFGRFAYEVSISLFGGWLQSKIFTNKDGAPAYKISHDLSSGWFLTLLDGSIYSVVNNAWNQNDKYKADFTRMIYESDNVKQTLIDQFKSHPEILQKMQAQLIKIEDVMNEVNVKLSKGTMVDQDIEKEFIKAGLIDNIFNMDGSIDKRELNKDYIYHEMAQKGFLDPDLFKKYTTDEELKDQTYDMLAKVMYDDAYENKSTDIKYPFAPPIHLGNINWMEFRTGSETLDRMAFYPFWDLSKTPLAYAKNLAVYNVLCKGYWNMPGKSNEYAAILINAAYKAFTDPVKFYLREQATGH